MSAYRGGGRKPGLECADSSALCRSSSWGVRSARDKEVSGALGCNAHDSVASRPTRLTIRRQRGRRVGSPGLQFWGLRLTTKAASSRRTPKNPPRCSAEACHQIHVDRRLCQLHTMDDIYGCIVHRIASRWSFRLRSEASADTSADSSDSVEGQNPA